MGDYGFFAMQAKKKSVFKSAIEWCTSLGLWFKKRYKNGGLTLWEKKF